MSDLKRIFKRNSHNYFFKQLAGFGRSLNRLYENRNHDIYSNGELTVIRKISGFNPNIIIDGGANVGNYSLTFNKFYSKGKIYAFEPVNNTFKQLENNVKPHKNIIPVNKGLYSENCRKEIQIFNSCTHSSLYEIKGISSKFKNTEIIELVKGDDFVKENGINDIDFIKLDIEGSEYTAIKGFEQLLKRKKIKTIQFEYGYINITTKNLLVDFYELFNDYGYKIGKIFPKNVEFRDYHFIHEDFIGPNFIAVNKDEKDIINILRKK